MSVLMSENYCPTAQSLDRLSLDERAVDYAGLRGISPLPSDNIRVTQLAVHQKRTVAHNAIHVLRRMRGFLIEMRGEEARVYLDDNMRQFEYWMPAKKLTSAAITEANQPFEMDEFEGNNADGSYYTGYTFRPLAKAVDAIKESFALDEERTRKRDLILKKFGNAPS